MPPLDVFSSIRSNLQDFMWQNHKTRHNMKLQLGTFQLALAWTSLLWFQAHWGIGVNGSHVNTCITTCHVLCVVWKFHSFPNLELQWSLSLVGSFFCFYIGRNNSQEWHQNVKTMFIIILNMMLCVLHHGHKLHWMLLLWIQYILIY